MTNEELIAVAAMANIEAVLMAGENAARARNDEPPAWAPGYGFLPAGNILYDELQKRSIIP